MDGVRTEWFYKIMNVFTIKSFATSIIMKISKESILRDVTPFGLRIKKNPGINVISSDFMNRWNSALKIAERSLVELLREETEKVVEISTYKLKSTWNPPKISPALELFLSKVKEESYQCWKVLLTT